MANIYYVDHGGSNTAPYDTQAKAAPALAIILAIPPAAGDIIYCCDNAGVGETTAAVLSCASSGTNAAGYIKVIGCNSSGIVDGTRYVIDANGGDYDIIDLVGKDLWWFENIEVHNNGGATQHGFYTSTSGTTGCVHINCCAHNCTGSGFDENNQGTGTFVRCCSYSNTADGFAVASYTRMVFCVARDNTADGFGGGSGFSGVVYGCVSHGNGDDGFGAVQAAANLIGCVADGNTDDGIEIGTGSSLCSA
ncbi:MAG: hypothetical protein IMZ61_15460, partial [Planctomycetes bacterium]|nr:hypothetical protein [Planctomycetota bacterium]